MVPIHSIKDERIVEARSLNAAAGRLIAHKLLLEGEEIINWALQSNIKIERVFINEKIASHLLLTELTNRDIHCHPTSEGILKKIADTRYVIPFIGVAKFPCEAKVSPNEDDFVIVLDGVQDRGNIGTIIRTARSFGIRHILTTGNNVDLFYKKTIEASRGMVFQIFLSKFNSDAETIEFLKRNNFQIITTSPHAPLLQSSVKLNPRPIALVLGNESHGVSDLFIQNSDFIVKIPMSGQVESLNVSVAAGISVYEFKLKLVLAMLTKYIRMTLGREMNVTGKLVQAVLDKRLKAVSNFNSTQVIFLMILKCDQEMTMEQISRDTATFGDELNQLLQPLLKDGYIHFLKQNNDTIAALTEKGEEFLGQIWNVVETSEHDILAGFTEQEKHQFNYFINRIQENCKHII